MSDDALHRLISAWLDGRITEDDSSAIQEMLRSSKAARDEFSRWTQLDAALRETTERGAETAAPEKIPAAAPPLPQPESPRPLPSCDSTADDSPPPAPTPPHRGPGPRSAPTRAGPCGRCPAPYTRRVSQLTRSAMPS